MEMNICTYNFKHPNIILSITYFITLQHDFEIERIVRKSIGLHSRKREKRKANGANKPDCNLTCIFIDPTYVRISCYCFPLPTALVLPILLYAIAAKN